MIFELLKIASTSAFILLLVFKFEIDSYFQESRFDLIAKLFSCDFCLSFWINFLICLGYGLFIEDYFLILFGPVINTPITRKLI